MYVCVCVYLIVFNGLGERLHVDRLVQLVFVQQVDEEIQRTFMDAHLRVQRANFLIDIHTALSQSPDTHTHTNTQRSNQRTGNI